MTGGEDPEYADIDPAQSSMELITYAMAMADERGKNPTDDIVTTLIEADLDGEKLSDDEFGFFVIMLAVAGNETTRNSITHGMIAFSQNPDQWELFKKERPSTAADEIVRWATPVSAFQRTANEDLELGGVQIEKGQRLVMSYRSANFDEEIFEHPHTFDILRDPNPHVGFGGTGAHYCIGANLARMTINLIFNAVADHMPDLKPVGEPERLRSGWLNGIKHWQVDYTGAGEPANQVHGRAVALRLPGSRRIRVDFSPDEGQQAVADVVTSVLDRDNSWDALVAGGVTALAVPERLGGDGLGLSEIATALTEIGRHGTISPALATLGLGSVVLLDLASDAQQDRYLAGVAKGSVLTAALNEPGAPLPDRPATTFANGRLNGTKVAVPYAEQADWIVVTADSAVVVVSSEGRRRAGDQDPVVE